MFKIETELGSVKPVGGRRVADPSRQANLTLVTPATEKGDSLFLLTWEDRLIPLATTRQEAFDGWGRQQIHVHIRAIGPSKAAENAEIRWTELSQDELRVARLLAMESLLVFGGYFDGLTYPDGFFVVRCMVDGAAVAYTLSSFGYPPASRPPEYHAKLEEFRKRVREAALQDAWGRNILDKLLAVELQNKLWFLHETITFKDVLTPEDVLLPGLPKEPIEELQSKAKALAGKTSLYGRSHLDGENAVFVLARMATDHPGFSAESYRKVLASGVFTIRSVRASKRERRQERIAKARASDLLDAVFELHFFNRRWAGPRLEEPEIPVHETLGDLYSAAEIDAAIAKTDKLIQHGRQFSYPNSDADKILKREHPGFSNSHIHQALSWGFQENR